MHAAHIAFDRLGQVGRALRGTTHALGLAFGPRRQIDAALGQLRDRFRRASDVLPHIEQDRSQLGIHQIQRGQEAPQFGAMLDIEAHRDVARHRALRNAGRTHQRNADAQIEIDDCG